MEDDADLQAEQRACYRVEWDRQIAVLDDALHAVDAVDGTRWFVHGAVEPG